MRLTRRGYAAAVDHPTERARGRRNTRRLPGTATVLTLVLLAISAAELAWILVR
jgi:hypothetical protein